MRTPLAIILGFASVLSEGLADSSDPTVSESVQAIAGAANRLKTIINELVDFAAARSSTSERIADRFELSHLIEQAIRAVSYQANQAEVKIVFQPSGRPLLISGNRLMLTQAISHLLDNAIKFNCRGGMVYVRALQEDEQMVLEIEDTGIGIPVAEQKRIFEMFYQVEAHMTRRQGGLGMGLAIAKRAIELHGGHIEVSSAVGKGSCFRVILPSVPQQPFFSPRAQIEIAHQQTLAYGQDLARAFIAQRTLAQRLRHVAQMCRELERLAQSGNLSEVRAIAQQILQEASTADEARER
ncbi:MAG: sensor histidine kinase, partial [Anaerolineae bacterium]